MWEYPKSQLRQAAINKMKPELDRAAARATASELMLHRQQEASQALKDQEISKLATLAKTQRLRAARLALLDAEPKKPKRGAVRKSGN
jgi:hypothetical protein